MKKVVKIEGLDCPNCAKTLEIELNKLEGVKNAEINFVKGKLSFESEDIEKAENSIVAMTKKVEPNAKIILTKPNSKKFSLFIDLLTLCFGTILGVLVLVFQSRLPLWAFWIMIVLSALLLGYKTYLKAILLLFKGIINENLLITISVIGATALGEYMEGLMVIFLYTIGKILEKLAVDKSRKSIEKLTNLQPEYAVVVRDEKEIRVEPSEVNVGEVIIVKPGERVPIDGVILDGNATLDMQSLTGESVPVSVQVDDNILSGAIVLDGLLKIKTTEEYKNSTVSKIMNLIENAQDKKSKTETFISKITRWYTLGIIILAVLTLGIGWVITKEFSSSIYRALKLLVVSCPCAFAISVPLSYFSGLGNASKNGILIKGSNYLDALGKINLVAFDKTGTLTTGEFQVEKVESLSENYSEDDIIYLASLGEQYSLHPLAKSIVKANKRELEKIRNVKEVAGEGVYFKYNKKEFFVGRKTKEKNVSVEIFENNKLIGKIYLNDTIKDSSKEACEELKNMGVKMVLLSGDSQDKVAVASRELGIDEFKAQLLPQDKYKILEDLKQNKENKIAYVGDGINDAPSLTLADVGISMGINGSPASIEASDVVLGDDNIKKIPLAIKISRFTRKIVWSNIILSAIVKLSILVLSLVDITGMMVAVFADVGVTLLAILNSLQTLYYNPSKKKTNLKKVN